MRTHVLQTRLMSEFSGRMTRQAQSGKTVTPIRSNDAQAAREGMASAKIDLAGADSKDPRDLRK